MKTTKLRPCIATCLFPLSAFGAGVSGELEKMIILNYGQTDIFIE
jgi:hypothetical protein